MPTKRGGFARGFRAVSTLAFKIVAGRRRVYDALRRRGMTKQKAARIANAGKTHADRSRMAKKAWRTRRMRGRG